jgi:phosphohistidine swiveling domain-containing protein
MERRATQLASARTDLASITDEQLLRRIAQISDLLVRAWDLNNLNTFVVGVPIALISRRYGDAAGRAVRTGTQNLRSTALLAGVRNLTVAFDADIELKSLMANTPEDVLVDTLRARAPQIAALLDRLILTCGHRGPGETDLSNPVYRDAPELLLRAALGGQRTTLIRAERPPISPLARLLAATAVAFMQRREASRDVSMRVTHELRLAVREWGRRLSEQGLLDSAADVHYLSFDEIFVPPLDAAAIVTRRRAERDRLRDIDFPVKFTQPWQPQTEVCVARAGEVLSGMAVSPGVARGRVRIMTDAADELEPGEVLVANVTDTGWTPFFGCAAAIVTNIGGAMSHAAIVAREFGVPAVVNTATATRHLCNGQLVEVDGTAGTVRVVEDPAGPASVILPLVDSPYRESAQSSGGSYELS